MRSVQIMVIGGGAAGMMAAVTAARSGKKVLLMEKGKKLGKKLLATGNGRCNFTNEYQSPECYRGEDRTFIWTALQEFPQEKTLEWFHDIGILPKARDGYYYPASGQAVSVVEALVRQLKDIGVEVRTEEAVVALSQKENGYLVETEKTTYLAKKVILTVGGMAAPVHGSTGDGYALAQCLGVSVIPPLPALTSLVLKGDFMKEWTGVRVQGSVELFSKSGESLAKDRGELQMVDYGISGIPVFQISRYGARALEQGDKPYLLMDIMPEYSGEELLLELKFRRQNLGKQSGQAALEGMLHTKLTKVLLKSLGMSPERKAGEWTDREMERLTERMKQWKLGIARVSGFEKAQVTCGGVSVEELDVHTMEVKKYPGLYMAGELLDVDGICGGYNLQWAWTSGYLAGKACTRYEST